MLAADPYDLGRFVEAQDRGASYRTALAEIGRGQKSSHWMWYVFPQIAGLGQSPVSRSFAISSLDEARAYLAHPVLGPRLCECARALLGLEGRSALDVFGITDSMKLRSSMTLFMRADPDQRLFAEVLERYFAGLPDPATDARL